MNIALIGCITTVAAMASEEIMPASGEANCLSAANADGCRIAWNLSQTPREFYRVQRFDADQGEWKTASRPVSDSYSATEQSVGRGGLYRVAGCNDAAAKRGCVYSTVVWIPILMDATRMPSTMVLQYADGKQADIVSIDRDTGYHLPQIQYNVYSMINAANRLGVNLPEMAEPHSSVDPGTSAAASGSSESPALSSCLDDVSSATF